MFHIPARILPVNRPLGCKLLRPVAVQLIDPVSISRISELDITKATPKSDLDIFNLISSNANPQCIGRFDLLVNDTKRDVEIRTNITDFLFTVRPNCTYTIFGSPSQKENSLVKHIFEGGFTPAQHNSPHVTLYLEAPSIHDFNQLCIFNDTYKWVTVHLLRVSEIDKYFKAKPSVSL